MGRKLYAKGEGFNPTTGIDDVEGLREELDALKGGSGGGGGDNAAIERRLTTAEGEIDDLQRDVAEQSEEVAAVGAKVNTLQGSDTGKSVRTIAAEETAKIVGNAPPNLDTLKEIADYISSDAEGAAELRNKVNKNATDIAALQSTKASKVEAQGYAATAKNEAIAAAAADAQKKADTAENNANDYTDGAVDGLAKGQVATNKANIASLSATVKTNANNIATHTQQIANLDSNKLGKTEKAADSAKSDYATSAGSATNATNASQLGGVAAADYMQTKMSSSVISSAGWYRIGETVNPRQRGNTFRLFLKRRFTYKATEAYIFDITVGWENVTITQVSGTQYSVPHTLIDKIRIDYPSTDAICYIDIHTITTQSETFVWQVIGDAVAHNTATLTDTLIGTAFEFSTVVGMSSSQNITAPKFIGALQGNADSATKLATPRSLWGQSFDGSKDINGVLNITGETGYSEGIRIHPVGGLASIWLCAINNKNYDAGMWGITAMQGGNLRFRGGASAATDLMVITQGGNVGIGKTNPTEKLDVTGNIKASGMLITGSDAQVGGEIDVEGGIKSRGDIDASGNNIKGNLDGTIKAVMRNTNLFLLGFAQEAGAAAKPYVTTQVSVNNGVLTIKGLRVEGDVEITGNTVIGGRVTSAASYQSSPISTTSEEGVPTTEEQLREQISTLEERIAVLEQLIAQNNG